MSLLMSLANKLCTDNWTHFNMKICNLRLLFYYIQITCTNHVCILINKLFDLSYVIFVMRFVYIKKKLFFFVVLLIKFSHDIEYLT